MSHHDRCPYGPATFELAFQVLQHRLRQTVRRIPRFGGNDQLHIPSKFVLREIEVRRCQCERFFGFNSNSRSRQLNGKVQIRS